MKKFDSINVIPFVDILLVLLAIVLMSSSFIAKGIIPVALPQSHTSETISPKALTLVITEEGALFADQTPLDIPALERELSLLPKQSHIAIHCDKNAPFHFFVAVLDLLKQHALDNLEIVTKR